MRRLALAIAVTALVALAWLGYSWWPYVRGTIDARRDLEAGHTEVKVYGLPSPWADEYTRVLHERYGVTVNWVAGCVVTDDLVRYVRGYNSISEAELKKRFGKDIFEECAADAQHNWEVTHGRQ